jgi:hypothetical protein
MISKEGSNHEKIVKKLLVYMKSLLVSLVHLAYTSLRESGCSVCKFHTLVIQHKKLFIRSEYSDYSPITVRLQSDYNRLQCDYNRLQCDYNRLQAITERLQPITTDYSTITIWIQVNTGVYMVLLRTNRLNEEHFVCTLVRRNVFSVLMMICVGERYTFIAMVFIRNLFQFVCELQDSKRILYRGLTLGLYPRSYASSEDEVWWTFLLILHLIKLRIFQELYSCWSMSVDWNSD